MAAFNKGDVSEGILAAAITARFMSKTKIINETDIINLIKKLSKATNGFKGMTSITSFSSPNAQKNVIDTVICKVNLAANNMNAFLDQKIYSKSDIMALVRSSVIYANSTYIKQWADLFYNNNQKNIIEVNAEGLLDQTGTKVDLKVIVDGIKCGVGVSLKAGDVKQFGQVGGSKWSSMKTLFEPLGVTFSKQAEDSYIDMLAKKQLAPALTTAYIEAFKQITKKDQKFLRKSIADYMKHHATSGEENVVLVQLNSNTIKVYDFDLLEKKLSDKTIEVKLTSGNTDKLTTGGFEGTESMSKSSIPKMIFMIDNKILFEIRLKLEGNRFSPSAGKTLPLVVRNYIEKGEMTTKLLT
jgi:hypothetical protein